MAKAEEIFVAINRWALILILAAMSIVVFANVTLRYLTNDSIVWAEELARYLMIWMTFLGAGLVLRFGGHVAIDNIHFMLSKPLARLLRIILCLLLLAFFVVMIWQSLVYMDMMSYQTMPAMGFSFDYAYAAFPIGFGLLIIHLLLIMRSYVLEYRFAESDEMDAEAAASI